MGYATAIGVGVMEEVASVNERLDIQCDAIHTSVVTLQRDTERGHQWSRRVTDDLLDMHRTVEGNRAGLALMRGEMDRMRREMDGLLTLNIRMHEVIMELWAAVRHGPQNPIVVEDDVLDAAVPIPPPRTREVEEEGRTLLEIIEETPENSRASSLEV